MYWTRGQLEEAILNKDPKIKNYLDTFGFVVIKDFLDKKDYNALRREYDAQYLTRWPSMSILERIKIIFPTGFYVEGVVRLFREVFYKPGMRFLPNFVDSSAFMTEYFFKDQMQKFYRYFAGEEFLYLGSDGSYFRTTSFPWHRDWYTKNPILKMNFYFSDFPYLGGRFKLIPGSNFAGDAYAALLQKSMAWPLQNKVPGGLNENDFFPRIENPRQGYFSSKWRELKNIFGFASQDVQAPHVSLKLGKRDVVIFDQRLIHCVETNFPKISRRLLTILLSKNAFEFSKDHYLLQEGNTPQQLMREILDLVVSERNHIGIKPYGKAIYDHPISKSAHFITIEQRGQDGAEESKKYNYAHFMFSDALRQRSGQTDFSSQLDENHYAEIGKKLREGREVGEKDKRDKYAQSYTYQDVHLGVNAQNITNATNS